MPPLLFLPMCLDKWPVPDSTERHIGVHEEIVDAAGAGGAVPGLPAWL